LVTNVTGVVVTATIGDKKCWTLGEAVGVIYSGNEWDGNIGGITDTSITIVIPTLSGEIVTGNVIEVCHGAISSSSSSSSSSESSVSSSSSSSSSSNSSESSSSSSVDSSSSSSDSSSSSSVDSSSSSSSVDSSSSSSSGCPDCEMSVPVTAVNLTVVTFTSGDTTCWEVGTLVGVLAAGNEFEGSVASKTPASNSVVIVLPTLSGEISVDDRINVCHGYRSSSSSSSSVDSSSSSSPA